ncbi:CYTH domain-containing protein [Microbacterium halotolerans]|uniref:CYTH domain-containing protein n=1 Tax=Microbacterium halotolerans TaxID=246613 RepID=UPI000E6AE156|nr:CYTH domain-containing protein [Microbacterium halotolerans]
MAAAAGSAPERSIEIEKKFDVDEGTPVPDWSTVPSVHDVSAGEERHLDATYFDTAEAVLAGAGVALRRRTGGPDAGWHIKGPLADGGRTELGWPLGDGQAVPDEVRAELARWTSDPLEPLARIVNDRTAYALRDAAGGVVAEFVDDRVRATDLRAGVEQAWCEWEVELGPAAPADHESFFAEITRIATAAGARGASSASKLARALGH